MFRKSRREWLVSLLLVPIVALISCAPQEAAGALNFYTTFAPPELRVAMSKTMKDNYGIKMEWLVNPGATNAERILISKRLLPLMGPFAKDPATVK